MANDVNANIRVGLDTSDAVASLKSLQSQITAFNKSVVQSNAAAVAAQKGMISTLTAQIGATKQFSTSMVNVETSVSRLGRAIDKNKLSLGEYFKYGVASSKNFGRVFGREHTAIMDLATERVKKLQTQYIALGQAQNGMTRAMAVRPMNLFNADTAIAIQRQQLFNKLLHDGSTSLINFGKNTQWAGRQLMVGFTVPLTIFGGMAGQVFMDLERQMVNFRRVYGDATTPLEETNGMIQQIQELGKEFTKYGIAVKDTIGLASDAAAAGAQGEDLLAQTAQATRLSTLGMIDQQQALTATIALQSAFRLSAEELANSVNFLNAVENQTVVSLADITEAIPKVAPVIQGLGGDVGDLAVFMAALREGGVSAAEGANALKSGLASLINPTNAAKKQLKEVGINIDAIIQANKGDIQGTVRAFGQALSTLDKFSRQQTLAKVFGKYQFARLGALFENIAREGSQAQRVVDLNAMSIEQLAELADKELGAIEESVGAKFTAAMEKMKLAIAPIGEAFLKIATPIIEGVTKIFDKFNELNPAVKNFAVILAAGLGVVVPTVIMLIGLFANFAGQAIKGFSLMNNFFNRLRTGGQSVQYLSEEQLAATAAAASLEGQTNSLTGALNVQRNAVQKLARSYMNYVNSAQAAATNLPQGFGRPGRKMASGGMVGGTGNKDTEPALLTPGEFVMNRQATKEFGPILDAMNRGVVSGYADGSRLTQRTHITGAVSVSATEALAERITNSTRQTLQVIQRVEEVLGRSIANISKVSNLIVEMPKEFNMAMKSGIEQGQFAQQFGSAGVEKYRTTAAITKQDFETLRPHLEILDKNILEASKDFKVVGDTNIDQITKKAFEGLPAQSREMLSEIEGLSTQFHNLRISVSDLTQLTEAEQQKLKAAGISYSLGNDPNRQYINAPGLGRASTRTRQETRSAGSTYRRSPLFYAGVGMGEAIDDGARTAIQAASPSKKGKKVVEDYGDGMLVGAANASVAAGNAGKKVGKSFSINLDNELNKKYGGRFPGFKQSGAPMSDINQGGDQISQATNQTVGAMNKVKAGASKFGSTLLKGSAKVQGALFAVDGLVFAASMMDNSLGQFAQKIMPAIFAIQGVTMALPAISGGITALAGAMGMTTTGLLATLGPIGLAVAAIGGLVIASKIQADKQNESIKANQKYIDATLGSAAAMTNFAKATNKQTILQKEAALNIPMPSIGERQKAFAEEFVANETGKQITESLKLISEGPERIQALRAELIQAIAAGYLNPKQAKAVARQISIELGDPIVGNSVIGSIENALTKNGKRLKDAASKAFLGTVITPEVAPQLLLAKQAVQNVERATLAVPTFQEAGGAAVAEAVANVERQQLTKEQGGAAFQVAATNATKLREAIALLNIDLAEGKITQEEYDQNMKLANDRFREQISIISELGPAIKGGSDAVGGFFKNYAVMMGMTEEDFSKVESSVSNITNMLSNVPDTLSTDLTFSVATGGMSIEQLTTLESLFLLGDGQGQKNQKEFELLLNSGGDYTPEQITQFYLSIAMYPDNIRKTVEARFIENGLQDAQNYLYVLSSLSTLPPRLRNIIEPQILGVGIEGLKTAKYYLDYLNDIPEKQRKDYIIAVTQLTFRKDIGETLSATQGAAERGSAGAVAALARGRRRGLTPQTGTSADEIANQIQKELDAQIAAITNGDKNTPPVGGDSGGSKTKSWLEQLIADTEANLKIFPAMVNKLRKYNVPQQIIEAMGVGEEGLKNAEELFSLGSKGIAKFVKQYGQSMISQAVSNVQGEVIMKKQETAARNILKSRGLEKDLIDSIVKDQGAVFTILFGTNKQIDDIVSGYTELQDEQDTVAEKVKEIEQEHEKIIKVIDKEIDAQKEVVDGIQNQIDALEQKNAQDEWTIRGKEREKELIDRQIESLERANEIDQRRIETLQRQDELRNREADALSHELEAMSDLEQQIRDSYQTRIDALDKVAQVNDYIINQQKQQLDLSRAVSEGDIYAATAAAQQMRQSSAQFAQQQTRSALDQGMENAVAGLRTSGGLTREQAEQQIKNIKEQSYQTSLLIRDIEDVIYQRNQEMVPLKDQQYQLDLQIRDLNDQIYERQTQIHDITIQQLEPAQQILENLNKQKSEVQQTTDDLIEQIKASSEIADITSDATGQADNLAAAWHEVGKAIDTANKLAKQQEAKLIAPERKKGETSVSYADRLARYEAQKSAILAQRDKAINDALASGRTKMGLYMGGEVKKYALGGSVSGSGGGDTRMAMLSPGEFVIRKAMVNKYGKPMFKAINQGAFSMPEYSVGAEVEGPEVKTTNNVSNINAPVYNTYDMKFAINGTNANADDIANRVMFKMRQIQDQGIRSNRGY